MANTKEQEHVLFAWGGKVYRIPKDDVDDFIENINRSLKAMNQPYRLARK